MGRVLDYDNDLNINGDDKVLGTDSTTGRNKNYRIDTLVDYLNTSGSIGVLGQLGYVFNSESPALHNTFHKPGFGGDNSAISSLTNLVVSKYPIGSYDVSSYLQSLVGKNILLANVTNLANWGVFTLTDVSITSGDSNYYSIAITHVSSSGILEEGQTYGIAAEGLQSTVPIQNGGDIVEALNTVTPIVLENSRVEAQGIKITKEGVSYTFPDPDENANSGQGYILYTDATGNLNWKEFPLDQVNGVFFADPGTFETP